MEANSSQLKEQFLEEKISFPYDTSSLLNDFFLGWVFGSVNFYRRNPPKTSNLYEIPANIDIEPTLKALKKNWKIEQKTPQPSFFRAMMKTIYKDYTIASLIIMVGQLQFLPQALLTSYLVQYLMDPQRPEYEGVLLTLGFIFTIFLASVTKSNGGYRVLILTGKIKNIIARMITEKTLRLNDRMINEESTRGKILNILSNDMEQLELVGFIAYLWSVPLIIIFSILILTFTFGPVGILGIGLSFLHFFMVLILGKTGIKFNAAANILGDTRVKMIENLIAGIKIMKLYAWEIPILKTIFAKRKEEIAQLSKRINVNGAAQVLGLAGIGLIIYITLLVQVSVGNTLTPGSVLIVLIVLTSTHVNIVYLTTAGFGTLLVFVSIMKRTGEILSLREFSKQTTVSTENHSIEFTGASFSWRDDSRQNSNESNQSLRQIKDQLVDISIKIAPGELIMVVGPVGCGKSSLLMGILGELNLSSGRYSVQGSVAYASEESWIISGSIKENILMGRPYNASSYAQVINSCSLAKDLELFRDGHDTLVGDRGVTLSGGQKSRISLARAIYSQADIVLLDDPLSAVDAEVANHIFQGCIKEHLSGKTVVLATHQVQFLSQADKLVVLDNGNVTFYGTYEELTENLQLKERLGDFAFRKEETSPVEKSVLMEYKNQTENYIEDTSEVIEGSVKIHSYYRYAKLGFGSILVMTLIFLIMCTSQFTAQSGIFLASYWSNQPNQDSSYYIQIMGLIILCAYIGIALRIFIYVNLLLKSNIPLHNNALESVAKSPAVFFDTNPTGHIINRFSKDIGVVDGPLQYYLFEASSTTIIIIGHLTFSFVVVPYNLLAVPVMALMLYYLFKYVSPIIIQLRRLELVSRGALLSTLNSAMNGLPTLRCLQLQSKFKNDVKVQAGNHYRSYLTFHTILRFSQLYSDIATGILVCLNIVVLVATRGYIDPFIATFSIATTTTLIGLISVWNKNLLETGTNMASAQRLLEYADMPNEGCFTKPENFIITQGGIEFREVYMRYRPNLPQSLSGLNLTIKAGHKVGIVGRTGAGKSSILQVLFRLVNPESGTILIDGHDYLGMGLHDLRKQMSVIPQSAILFTTTVRENLDPFLLHTDQELIDLLEEFKLKDAIFEHAQGLDAELNGEGISFSAGQKQLLCLARAVLRRNKIIMMDEATANVDNETDRIIQETVKQKFKGCTLLVIAHRIRTIIESDVIVVMDNGMCKEYGSTSELYENNQSLFRNLIHQSGIKESEYLISKFS